MKKTIEHFKAGPGLSLETMKLEFLSEVDLIQLLVVVNGVVGIILSDAVL
jgi:hypothetical protein